MKRNAYRSTTPEIATRKSVVNRDSRTPRVVSIEARTKPAIIAAIAATTASIAATLKFQGSRSAKEAKKPAATPHAAMKIKLIKVNTAAKLVGIISD
jgi:hypothetical protein